MFLKLQYKPNYHNALNKVFFILFLLFSLYSSYLMGVSPFEYVRFFAFTLSGIFCTGFLLARKISCDNSAELYSYSIAFGVGVNAIIYVACGLVSHLELYRFFAVALCFISPVMLAFDVKKKPIKKEQLVLSPTVITCTMLMLFVVTFTLGFRNISPQIVGQTQSYPDVIWSLGNINALTQSFPPRIPHLNIGVLQYHYFAMLLRAMLSLATAISTEKIFFILGQFIIVPFLIVSVYAFFKKILKSQHAEIALPIFLLSGCASSVFYIFGRTTYFLNHFFSGFWGVPNGSDVAISFFCLWLLSFVKIYNGDFIAQKVPKLVKAFLQFAALAGFCFLATLSKGPFGALCVAAAVGVPFCLAIQKKPFLKTAFYSLATAVGFLLTIMFFVSTVEESNTLFLSATVKNSLFWKNLIEPVLNLITGNAEFASVSFLGGNFLDISILAVPLHAMLTIFPTCIFMIFLTVKLLKNFKDIPFETFLLLGTAYAGLLCGYAFIYSGSSQTYFILAAHLSVTALGLQWLFANYKSLKKPFKNIIIIAFAFSFITGINEYAKYTFPGVKNFAAVATHRDVSSNSPDKSCTRQEYEAAMWIKENTPESSIIATNRHFLTYPTQGSYPPDWWDARYFYLGAYSSRQMFLEGWSYAARDLGTQLRIRQVYEANLLFYLDVDNDKPKLMEAVDVDYIYVSKFVTPNLELPDVGLAKVFSNSAADIYAIA